VKEVKDIVTPGDVIKARVYRVDQSSGKVGLTMRSEQRREERAEVGAPQQRYGQRSEGNAQQREGQSEFGRVFGQRDGQRSMRVPAGEGTPVQARARRAPRGRGPALPSMADCKAVTQLCTHSSGCPCRPMRAS
jgi:transcriptional accessory protein Tex/SPT6